jgi:hypothetical protein
MHCAFTLATLQRKLKAIKAVKQQFIPNFKISLNFLTFKLSNLRHLTNNLKIIALWM